MYELCDDHILIQQIKTHFSHKEDDDDTSLVSLKQVQKAVEQLRKSQQYSFANIELLVYFYRYIIQCYDHDIQRQSF